MKYLLKESLLNFTPGLVMVEMMLLLAHVEGKITHNMQDYKCSHQNRLKTYKNVMNLVVHIKDICKATIHYMIKNIVELLVFESMYKVEIRNEFFLFCGDIGC